MSRQASIVRTVWLLRGLIGLAPLLWVSVGLGQTSITSSGLNTHISHTTGQQNYDITGGTRPGNGTNLFHSFGDFSVGAQDVARFLNDAHLPTTNILSRVTGGNPSNIFGEINTTNFPGANLYLINPAGVLFGATATLNVSGSVHVSTADYLRLADGLRFNAIPGPQDTLLSQAPVVAFGFLSAHPHPITVQGSQLTVPDGKSLSLVGGDVTITGGTLTAPGGQINVASVAGRGEARIAPEGITIAGMTPRGQIVIKGGAQQNDGALLDTSGAKGGAVVIRGGRLSMERAQVITEAKAANQTGGDIVIEAKKSATFGIGPFTVNDVILKTGSGGGTDSVGGAGSVSLTAPSITASNLYISTSPSGNGPAGDVAINVGSLTASTLQISSFVYGNRPAPASGNISIRATGDVTLQNNSDISTATFGLRDAGHITVRAATLTLTDGSAINSDSQPVGSAGGGRAGNIVVDVGRFIMRTSSMDPQISTDTLTTGHGGDISVRATDRVNIDRGSINAGTSGPGNGGSITLSTPRLTLNHSGQVTTTAQSFIGTPAGTARAGDISVHVRTLDMSNGGGINSFSDSNNPRSSAGNINIVASRSISMSGVSDIHTPASPTEISSTTSSAGQTGRVHIVTPIMHLDDRAVVSTSNQSTGHAGSVVLDVGRLDLLRGARIESSGLERSGGVVINAAKSITLDKGTITTDVLNSGQTGQSGNVSLLAGQSIRIGNGSRISADTAKDVGGNPGDIVRQDAGNIMIQAGKSVVVRDSTVSARAQAQTGNGGTIVIDAGKNFVSEASTLSAAAVSPLGGDSGQIRVTAGDSVRLSNGTVLDATNAGPSGTHAAHIVLDAGKNVVVDASRVNTEVDEGEAGQIEMHAGKEVRLVNGTVLDASASTHTQGGQIMVDAGRNILVDRSQVKVPVGDGGAEQKIEMHAGKDVRLVNGTVLDASSDVSGGGQIVVTGGNVAIDGSRLTADTAAGIFGNAGKVTVTADRSVRLINGTLVTASSPFGSSGGQVSVTAGNSVQLRNSTIQTSGIFGGGAIAITSETVRLKNGRLVSSAGEDVGGTITIKTNDFRRDAASVLDVSGSVGNGTVNIEPLP